MRTGFGKIAVARVSGRRGVTTGRVEIPLACRVNLNPIGPFLRITPTASPPAPRSALAQWAAVPVSPGEQAREQQFIEAHTALLKLMLALASSHSTLSKSILEPL